jgi:hypothetical protein
VQEGQIRPCPHLLMLSSSAWMQQAQSADFTVTPLVFCRFYLVLIYEEEE